MIDELVKVANAMEKADIVPIDWHPKLKVLPKVTKRTPCVRIWLTKDGHIKNLESLSGEHAAILRKFEPENGKSLPGFNVRPLYRLVRSNEEMKGNKFEKDIVEKSFQKIKGVLSLHPIRLELPERISAHVKICYLSFCILSLMQYKLKKLNISAVTALETLSTAYKVYLIDQKHNFKWSKVVTLKKEQEKIIKAIDPNFCSV